MNVHPETEARILVVDDEPAIVRLLVRALQAAGYSQVRGITDSTEVPGYLDSVSPDLVILDLNMPGLDGFELLEEISARVSQDTFLPVLAVSGFAGQDAKDRAFRAGAKDYLVKPLNLPELILHVVSLLDTRFLSLRLNEARGKMERLIGHQMEELDRSHSERQRAEKARKASEQRFRQVFDHMSSGVAVYQAIDGGEDFVLRELNAAGRRITKLKRVKAAGRRVSDVLPGVGALGLLDVFRRVERTGTAERLPAGLYQDKRLTFWVEHYASRLPSGEIVAIFDDVTEWKRAEEELRLKDYAFQSSLNADSIADPHGILTHANRSFLAAWGYDSLEQVIGRPVSDFVADPGKAKEILETLVARGAWEGEFLARKRDGATFVAESKVTTVRGLSDEPIALYYSVTDITARKQMEESLRLTRFSLDHSGVGVMWLDLEGRVRDVNEYICTRLGYSRDEMLSLHVFDITVGVLPERLLERWRELRENGPLVFEREFRSKSGEVFPVEIDSSILEYEGKEYDYGFVHEISERKKAEQQLADSVARLRESEANIIRVLSSVTELRDPYTAGHQQRVAEICVAVAERMGLPSDQTRGLEVAALLHDVGKVSVPIEILSNPGLLSPAQRTLVEGHVEAGYEILRPIKFPWPVAEIVLQHHERLDGSGYPNGLSGDAMALEAKILAVADTVEAMTSHRPYRAALGPGVALEELRANRGTLYDSSVVDAYLQLHEEGLGYQAPEPEPHLPRFLH